MYWHCYLLCPFSFAWRERKQSTAFLANELIFTFFFSLRFSDVHNFQTNRHSVLYTNYREFSYIGKHARKDKVKCLQEYTPLVRSVNGTAIMTRVPVPCLNALMFTFDTLLICCNAHYIIIIMLI